MEDLDKIKTFHRQAELSKYFSLFANSARIATLENVAAKSSSKIDVLIEVNGLNEAAIKNNLMLLKKHKFITGSLRSTKKPVYAINYEEIDKFKKQFDQYYMLLNAYRHSEESKKQNYMYQSIKDYAEELVHQFDLIPESRKETLDKIVKYIASKKDSCKGINLVYVCTHNSRRSHFGQIWARVAADYYNVPNVNTFSGGTEATAFNSNAINALKRIGFKIEQQNGSENPVYKVHHGDNESPSICFSKVYDHPDNPTKEFAAIMTCGEAEANCPFIPGVELRIATTYSDPKEFDFTPQQDQKYDERCRQIALDTFYVFSKLK